MRNVPAILVCDAGMRSLTIAGMTVLDRLVVTTHRAGCAPIHIVSEERPRLARADALGIQTTVVRVMPETNEPALLITGSVLVEVRDLEQLISRAGRLVMPDGTPLPVSMKDSGSSPVNATGIAIPVNDAASARAPLNVNCGLP